MTDIKSKIDHIVYAVSDLENALEWFEHNAGVRPTIGGQHLNQGTKNALLHLGGSCYLELITIDSFNLEITADRWMGVDLITSPKVTRWSLLSSNLERDSKILQDYNPEMGRIESGQRKMTNGEFLRWQMIMPLAKPEVELVPFMTDWQATVTHPTSQLPKACQLLNIDLIHQTPEPIRSVLKELELEIAVQQGAEPNIKLTIETPKGLIQI